MLKQLSFTFGSKPILENIIKQHPDRDFRLLQATADPAKLALFDLSGQDTVFKQPIKLKALFSVGDDKFKGLFRFQSFELGADDNEILKKQARLALQSANQQEMTTGYLLARAGQTNTTILITTWTNEAGIDHWMQTPDFKPINHLMDHSAKCTYFHEDYRPL